MLSPISKLSHTQSIAKSEYNRITSNGNAIQSLTDSLEELSMARVQYKQKDKNTSNKLLNSFVENDDYYKHVLSYLKNAESIEPIHVEFALDNLRMDSAKYQILRYLLTLNLSVNTIVFINKKLLELSKKKKKIQLLTDIDGSLDNEIKKKKLMEQKLKSYL